MTIIEELRKLGYDIKVNKNEINWTYQGEDEPDETKVVPLLEALIENKNDIIDKLICARCGNTAERFCFGDTGKQYKFARFCLECYPYHFLN